MPLLAIVAFGGLLRFYQIGSKGLWLDEAFSVWLGWQPMSQMLGWLVRIDQHPPLYYTLLHFWMILGDDPATVRALSAIFGTLTIPVTYLLGRRIADERVGLLTALILAAAPFHVHFAQEARMYTLLTLNAALALYFLARLLTDPHSTSMRLGQQALALWRFRRATSAAKRRVPLESPGDARGLHRCWLALRAIQTDLAWLGYMLFTTATLLSHNTAVFFPIATNLFVFGLILWHRLHPSAPSPPHPPSSGNWILAQAGTFLLWSPWLAAFVIQSRGVYHEFWLRSPTWRSVVETVGLLLCAFLPQRNLWLNVVWVLYATLLVLGVVHLRRRPAYSALLLIAFATPFVGELLVSLRRPIFYERTLIWTSLPLYLLLAAGLRQLRRLPYVLVGVLVILAVNMLSVREYYVNFQKEEWDKAAAYVAERVAPDDLILFNATWVQIPFDFYFRAYGHQVTEHGVPGDLFDRGMLEPKMTEDDLPRLRALIRGRERVWLVYSHDWYTDPQGLIPATLERELGLVSRKDFFGLQVRRYGAR